MAYCPFCSSQLSDEHPMSIKAILVDLLGPVDEATVEIVEARVRSTLHDEYNERVFSAVTDAILDMERAAMVTQKVLVEV